MPREAAPLAPGQLRWPATRIFGSTLPLPVRGFALARCIGRGLTRGVSAAGGAVVDFPAWFLTIIATLGGFNDMDLVEVSRWQRDGFERLADHPVRRDHD